MQSFKALRTRPRRFFWRRIKNLFRRPNFIPVVKLHKFKKEHIAEYRKKIDEYLDRNAPFIMLSIRDKEYDPETKKEIKELINDYKGNH